MTSMNKLGTWLGERKIQTVFTACFLILSGAAAWYASAAWEDYTAALQANSETNRKLSKLTGKTPPPSPLTLQKLGQAVASEQSDLNELLNSLQKYRIPAYADLDRAKPDNAPQQFQDVLREQVLKLKSDAAANGSTLPPLFYLGLEEYESKPPSDKEVTPLSRQLSVFNWIARQLIAHSGLILSEFSKISPTTPQPAKNGAPAAVANGTNNTPLPYLNTCGLKISFRGDQTALRAILNSFSQSPYFLVIDSLQLRNTVTEPPKRSVEQPAESGAVQRIPVLVGREQVTVSLRVRALEFPSKPLSGRNQHD